MVENPISMRVVDLTQKTGRENTGKNQIQSTVTHANMAICRW